MGHMPKIEIVPAVLAKTKDEFTEKLGRVMPYCTRVQIDIMDGKFVPNTTVGEEEEIILRKGQTVEYHLMVNDPINYMEKILEKSKVKDPIFIIHLESAKDPRIVFDFCAKKRLRYGIALNPDTPLGLAEKYSKGASLVLFMTVFPGFSGQGYISGVEAKVKAFRKLNSTIDVEVDGGIGAENIGSIAACGANLLAAASAIFGQKDAKTAIEELYSIASKATKD